MKLLIIALATSLEMNSVQKNDDSTQMEMVTTPITIAIRWKRVRINCELRVSIADTAIISIPHNTRR